MKNTQFIYLLSGILIGSFVVWFMTMSVVNTSNTGMMRMMGFRNTTNQINEQNSDTLDSHFIEQMIPHHEDAITMAKLALTNAQKPEIKQLAENIILSQGKEIEQMKTWYADWFGEEVPTGSRVMNQHGMMGDMSDITDLEKSTDFDRAFIEEMIPHHQMAVMMANMLKNGTARPEMKTLATDIITAQTKEINEMRQWYSDWGYAQ